MTIPARRLVLYTLTAALLLASPGVAGNVQIDGSYVSTVPTGTPPLVVSSSTKVDNLNADLLDGLDSSGFAPATHSHFGALWSGSSSSFGMAFQNTGSGDGIRALGATSSGNFWAAVYATNSGSSPGIYANTGSAGTYAGYFGKPIFVAGGCVGCLLVQVARNGGGEPLGVGDLVAVVGVEEPLAGTSTPTMLVERVAAGNAFAAIGVVQGRGVLEASARDGAWLEGVGAAAGEAEPGDYLFLVVQGMTQVKVDADWSEVRAGQRLVIGEGGEVGAWAGEPVLFEIGRALSEPDGESGLVWCLVGVR